MFSNGGGRFRAWAVVIVHGRLFWCVGDHVGAWVTIFICGQPFCCVGDRLCAWWSFPCVGGQLEVEVVVGVGGVVVAHGVVVLCSAGRIVAGWVVLTVLKNNNE